MNIQITRNLTQSLEQAVKVIDDMLVHIEETEVPLGGERVKQLEDELDQKEWAIKALEETLKEGKEQNRRLIEDTQETGKIISSNRNKIKELEAIVATKDNLLKIAKGGLDESLKECKSLKDIVTDREECIARFKNKVEILESSFKAVEGKNNELREEIRKQRDKVMELEKNMSGDYRALRDTIEFQKEHIENLTKENGRLDNMNDAQVNIINEKEGTIRAMADTIKELERKVMRLEDELGD